LPALSYHLESFAFTFSDALLSDSIISSAHIEIDNSQIIL
jgi:hypothetical protein